MPAKTTKSVKTKSNVARTTGKASLINKKVKFNWKIAVVIGVVLVASLGYLFVRLSQAGTGYYWNADQITVDTGTRSQKNGQPVIMSDSRSNPIINIRVKSQVSYDDTYCVHGRANTPLKGAQMAAYFNNTGTGSGLWDIPQGDFKKCFRVAGSNSSESRNINFQVSWNGSQSLYVTGMSREGGVTPPPAAK